MVTISDRLGAHEFLMWLGREAWQITWPWSSMWLVVPMAQVAESETIPWQNTHKAKTSLSQNIHKTETNSHEKETSLSQVTHEVKTNTNKTETSPGQNKTQESLKTWDCDDSKYSISALQIYPNLNQHLRLVSVCSTTALLLKYTLRALSNI